MKRKILIITGIFMILALSFLYVNQNYLIADDRDGKDCSGYTSSSCTDKNKEIKAGSDWNEYAFTTDQACCDEMKSDLQSQLMSISGVKEIKFGYSCDVSKMTQVKVFYNGSETSEDVIAASVKEKNVSSGKTGCDKSAGKTEGKKECAPHKTKTEGKDI